jgi:hypothetical protein
MMLQEEEPKSKGNLTTEELQMLLESAERLLAAQSFILKTFEECEEQQLLVS